MFRSKTSMLPHAIVALMLLLPAFAGLAHIIEATRPTLSHLSLIAFVPGLVVLAGCGAGSADRRPAQANRWTPLTALSLG